MNIFFDSSALAKRYIEEKGSDRLQAIISSASALGVSVICIPELISALYRRRRERRLSSQQYRDAKAAVFSDIEDASVIGISEEVIARSVELLEHFPLRSADALHIACAAEWSAELFVSADERQARANVESRLTVAPEYAAWLTKTPSLVRKKGGEGQSD